MANNHRGKATEERENRVPLRYQLPKVAPLIENGVKAVKAGQDLSSEAKAGGCS